MASARASFRCPSTCAGRRGEKVTPCLSWRGVRRPTRRFPQSTLWDDSSACDSSEEEAMMPASTGGQALTAFADGGALLVAGLEPPPGRIQDAAFALAWDTQTGERLAPLTRGMGIYRRAFKRDPLRQRGAGGRRNRSPSFFQRPVARRWCSSMALFKVHSTAWSPEPAMARWFSPTAKPSWSGVKGSAVRSSPRWSSSHPNRERDPGRGGDPGAR